MRPLIFFGLFLVLLLTVAGPVRAQELLVEPSIGLKAGVNSSIVQVQGAGTSSRLGFTGGAYFKQPLGQMTLQLEALYSQKGFQKSSYEDIQDWEVQLDYFELPVTLNVDVPMGKVNPYFYAGASLGFLTSSQEKHSETDGAWVDIGDKVNSSNWDLLFGFGLRITRLFFDFRFNHGISNINKDSYGTEIKDRTFSFTAGYAIWM